MPTPEQFESYWTTPIRESNTTPEVICRGIMGTVGPELKALKRQVEELERRLTALQVSNSLLRLGKRRA